MTNEFNPDCVCGDLTTLGVVHRKDGPCYYPEPKREWVGLTDEDEIDWDEVGLRSLVKAVEAKLKEKNI